jgi:hypothetical protein
MVAFTIMKQYVIDEIRIEDYKQIKDFLENKYGESELGGIYWIPVDEAQLTPLQSSHQSCQPFYVALDLEPDRLCCELLIRTKQHVRCDCMGYADEKQRNWIISSVDKMFKELEIIT